ncbi:MAG: hypothetical protein IJC69_06925 [Clostridia bacterium]|nr:hypothetical protein [Clostridia bacterium]
MKKNGKARIVVGYIMVAFQLIGMIGNAINEGSIIPEHPAGGYGVGYVIGYFLIGIIGLILLYFGYKAKANAKQDSNSGDIL